MAEKQSYSSHDGNVHLNSLSIENSPRVIQRNPLESVTISPIENSPRVIQRNPLESVTISPGSKMIGSTICFLYPGDKVQVPRYGTTFVKFSTQGRTECIRKFGWVLIPIKRAFPISKGLQLHIISKENWGRSAITPGFPRYQHSNLTRMTRTSASTWRSNESKARAKLLKHVNLSPQLTRFGASCQISQCAGQIIESNSASKWFVKEIVAMTTLPRTYLIRTLGNCHLNREKASEWLEVKDYSVQLKHLPFTVARLQTLSFKTNNFSSTVSWYSDDANPIVKKISTALTID